MTLMSSIWVNLNPVTNSTQNNYADPWQIPPYCLEGKLDFEPYVEAVFFSLITRKISFTSLGICFNLFLYTAVWKGKENFK